MSLRKTAAWVYPTLACTVAACAPRAMQVESSGFGPSVTWPSLETSAAVVGGYGMRDPREDAALIVALENYERLPSIPGAHANAKAWRNYLRDSMAIPQSRILVLLDSQAQEYMIEGALKEMAALVGQNGRFWFVFIGHGAPSVTAVEGRHQDGLLVGYGAETTPEGLERRSLSRSRVLDVLGNGRGEAIAVLDACFSGRAQNGGTLVAGLMPSTVVDHATPARVLVLTAANASEFAGPLPGVARPAFSYLLLGALRGWGDEDGDHSISPREAMSYTAGTLRAVLKGAREQHPTLDGTIAGPLSLGSERGPAIDEDWNPIVRAAPIANVPAATAEVAPKVRQPIQVEPALKPKPVPKLGHHSEQLTVQPSQEAPVRIDYDQLAEEAVVSTAVRYHQEAQRLRQTGVQEQNPGMITQAKEQYRLAVHGYRGYVQRYPNGPATYELQYNLADALFWSENYEEAALAYAIVRDSKLSERYLSESARRLVEAIKRLVDIAVERKEVTIRTEPPTPTGTPPHVSPVVVPPLIQRLAQARSAYLARVDDAHDTENVRPAYAYNNTLLLYQYGSWALAKERFAAIYEERCTGAGADETGRVAWLSLRNMAVALNQLDEVGRLGTDLRKRRCTFAATNETPGALDCSDSMNSEEPECLAAADIVNMQYKKAVDVFQRAEKSKSEDQIKLYEVSASMLVASVENEPTHPQTPQALEKAAIALERAGRFNPALSIYQRIIHDVGKRQAKDVEEQAILDAILANAYFRVAFNANRFFDYDRANENYRILADSKRFKKSTDKNMSERRQDALVNAARIFEYQQQYPKAAEYYGRAAELLEDANDKRAAYFRVAEMSYKQNKWSDTVTKMKEFINRYQSDPAAGELVVLASWRTAQAKKNAGKQRDYEVALADVVAAYGKSGQPPGSTAAEYAAQAKFALVDKGVDDFAKFQIKPGSPATMQAYADGLKQQIEGGASQAKQRNELYDAIAAYKRPTWTIASFVRQGRIYEILAKAVLNTPFTIPTDMKKQMAKLPEASREDVRVQVEDSVRQVLDTQTRPIECFAVVRYALAARAAKDDSISNEHTEHAIMRLNAYHEERLEVCIDEARTKDASMASYQLGEFTRPPRGMLLPVPDSWPPRLTQL